MSILYEPATYGIIAASLITLFVLVKLHIMRCVVFDVKDLHNCVKKGVGKENLEEAFEIINNELVKKYPNYIRPWSARRWMLFNGGGAMGQLTVLHASLSEYLIFYGNPLYSQGHSGRYLMDVYDFMIQGETKTFYADQFQATVYKAGEYSLLPLGKSKGYCCMANGWMLEYARGFIPLGLPYFICSSLFVTVDPFPWFVAVWKVGTQTAYNLLVNRKI